MNTCSFTTTATGISSPKSGYRVTKTDTNSFPEFKRKVWRKAGELVIRPSVVSRQGFAKSRADSRKIPSKVKKTRVSHVRRVASADAAHQESWERCWCSAPGTSELGEGLGDGIRGFRLAMTEVPESTDAKLPKPEVLRGRQAPV